jgi:hypothetical protein
MIGMALPCGVGHTAGGAWVASCCGHNSHVSARRLCEHDDGSAFRNFEHGRGSFPRQQFFENRRVNQSPNDSLIGIGYRRGRRLHRSSVQALPNLVYLRQIALRTEEREFGGCLIQISFRER